MRAAAVVPPIVLSCRPEDDVHAVVVVGHGIGAGDVGSDEVVRDHVADRAGIADVDAPLGVARDDVAAARVGRADRVGECLVVDDHAVQGVRYGGDAAVVRPDEVAGDHVLVRASGAVEATDPDAAVAVARDHVALTGPADGVVAGPAHDRHAI